MGFFTRAPLPPRIISFSSRLFARKPPRIFETQRSQPDARQTGNPSPHQCGTRSPASTVLWKWTSAPPRQPVRVAKRTLLERGVFTTPSNPKAKLNPPRHSADRPTASAPHAIRGSSPATQTCARHDRQPQVNDLRGASEEIPNPLRRAGHAQVVEVRLGSDVARAAMCVRSAASLPACATVASIL